MKTDMVSEGQNVEGSWEPELDRLHRRARATVEPIVVTDSA